MGEIPRRRVWRLLWLGKPCSQVREVSECLVSVFFVLGVKSSLQLFLLFLSNGHSERVLIKRIPATQREYASSRVRRINSVAISIRVKSFCISARTDSLSLSDNLTYQSPNSISNNLRRSSAMHGDKSKLEKVLAYQKLYVSDSHNLKRAKRTLI